MPGVLLLLLSNAYLPFHILSKCHFAFSRLCGDLANGGTDLVLSVLELPWRESKHAAVTLRSAYATLGTSFGAVATAADARSSTTLLSFLLLLPHSSYVELRAQCITQLWLLLRALIPSALTRGRHGMTSVHIGFTRSAAHLLKSFGY